jgi:hypothetical protein
MNFLYIRVRLINFIQSQRKYFLIQRFRDLIIENELKIVNLNQIKMLNKTKRENFSIFWKMDELITNV